MRRRERNGVAFVARIWSKDIPGQQSRANKGIVPNFIFHMGNTKSDQKSTYNG